MYVCIMSCLVLWVFGVHLCYIYPYMCANTVIAPIVHGPKTIVVHTLQLTVGKKLCDRGGYFELFRRKNFGYYDLLKSGTIADKLFTNALDVMTLVGLTTLDLSSAL